MGSLIGRVDRWQRRHAVVGFPVAVVKKFTDDAAGALAAQLSYYAFIATFPLLLVLITVLQLVLHRHPELQQRVLNSALSEFPVIGAQLRMTVTSVNRSGITLVLGLLVALVGARGVASTFQRVCNKLWSVPYVHRPPFGRALVRTVSILGLIFVGLVSGAVVVTLLSALDLGPATQVASVTLSVLITAALFVAVFRLATASQVPTRDLVRGAVASAVVWQALLGIGTALVTHLLRHATDLYGGFGFVLGLLAWFSLQATATLIAIESDVVRVRGLWPRGLQQPRTAADEAALAAYARGQQRDQDQSIHIQFEA